VAAVQLGGRPRLPTDARRRPVPAPVPEYHGAERWRRRHPRVRARKGPLDARARRDRCGDDRDELQAAPDEPFIVFDYKGEYREFLEGSNHDREVITLSSTNATHQWNLFEEIEREADIDEIASAMFPKTDETEFFSAAARQLFVAVVTYLRREAEWNDRTPTNADLVAFVQQMDKTEMHQRLSNHQDLVAAASAIDPDAERQAAGVYANFQQVMADLFRGDFAEAGEFSIREYMANPDERTLLLDYPIREGDAVAPAFRFFVDWSARFALTDTRGSYFLLDEFARLPGLRKVGDLINAGRSSNTQILLGLQSVAQLHDTYGQDKANALLSGLVQTVVLRIGDSESFEYVRGQLGREQEHRTVPAHDRRGRSVGRQEIQDETYPIAESKLARLQNGEAVAIVPNGWVRGQIEELAAVKKRLDRALEKVR
jgi:type IV secretory pathway TraG/TraD family ATPase VirD4